MHGVIDVWVMMLDIYGRLPAVKHLSGDFRLIWHDQDPPVHSGFFEFQLLR